MSMEGMVAAFARFSVIFTSGDEICALLRAMRFFFAARGAGDSVLFVRGVSAREVSVFAGDME